MSNLVTAEPGKTCEFDMSEDAGLGIVTCGEVATVCDLDATAEGEPRFFCVTHHESTPEQKSFTVIGVYPDDLWDEGAAGASYAEQVKAVDVQHAIRLAESLDSPNRAENAIVISVLEGWHTEAGQVDDYNG